MIELPNKAVKIPPRNVHKPPIVANPFGIDFSLESCTTVTSEKSSSEKPLSEIMRMVAISGDRGISFDIDA
jgi:hypothetical protein